MKVYRLCIPVRYRRIPDGAGYEGHGLCLVSFAGGRALQLHRRSTHGGGANSFFVVGFAVFSEFLGLSFSTCLARQRRLELPPLFALMDEKAADKNPTRYINAARTQEQPIWHYKFYMPSMAVYTCLYCMVVRSCKRRWALGPMCSICPANLVNV